MLSMIPWLQSLEPSIGGSQSGEAYVIYGKAGGFANIDITSLAPTDGFRIQDDNADDEAGFAYGTLPGHPERGEEAFLVRLLETDVVVGSVAAFSRPAPWGGSLVSPLAQRAQRIVARRYLAAMVG